MLPTSLHQQTTTPTQDATASPVRPSVQLMGEMADMLARVLVMHREAAERLAATPEGTEDHEDAETTEEFLRGAATSLWEAADLLACLPENTTIREQWPKVPEGYVVYGGAVMTKDRYQQVRREWERKLQQLAQEAAAEA